MRGSLGRTPSGVLHSLRHQTRLGSTALHFLVSHNGCRTLITHIFVRGDELLTSDAVFGVKDALVMDFTREGPHSTTPDRRAVAGTWSTVRFDIVLAPEDV